MSILLVKSIEDELPTGGIMGSHNEFYLYNGSSPELLATFQNMNGRFYRMSPEGQWFTGYTNVPITQNTQVTDPIILAILNDEERQLPPFRRYYPNNIISLESPTTVFNITVGYSIDQWYRSWIQTPVV